MLIRVGATGRVGSTGKKRPPAEAGPSAPVILSPPAFDDLTPTVGQELTISVAWSGDPTTITYGVLRDGAPLPNTDFPTYVVQPADEGTVLTPVSSATNDEGTTEEPGTATSAVGALVTGAAVTVSLGMNGMAASPVELRHSVKTSAAGGALQLGASLTDDMASPIFGPVAAAVAAGTGYYAQLRCPNLAEVTRYYKAVYNNGARVSANQYNLASAKSRTGGFGPRTLRYATGTCADSGSNHAVFAAISQMADDVDEPLDFLAHLGDEFYLDPNYVNATTQGFLAQYDTILATSRYGAAYRTSRVVQIPDDHSTPQDPPSDVDGAGAAAWAAWRAAYAPRVPMELAIPLEDGLMVVWTDGRFRFAATLARDRRSPENATDNAGKTMLGLTRKAALKDQMDAAVAYGQGFVWMHSCPLNASGSTDEYSGYSTERTELANYAKGAGLANRFLFHTGDNHLPAGDDGSSCDFATGGGMPMPHIIAAPLQRSGNVSMGSVRDWTDVHAYGHSGCFVKTAIVDTGLHYADVTHTFYKNTSATTVALVVLGQMTHRIDFDSLAPVWTQRPTISFGASKVGTAVTVTDGVCIRPDGGDMGAVSYTHQWFYDEPPTSPATLISGATAASFTPTEEYLEKRLKRVTTASVTIGGKIYTSKSSSTWSTNVVAANVYLAASFQNSGRVLNDSLSLMPPEIGAAWQLGTSQTLFPRLGRAGKIYAPATTSNVLSNSVPPGTYDYGVRSKFHYGNTHADDRTGVAIHYATGSTDRYYWRLNLELAPDAMELVKVSGGVPTTLLTLPFAVSPRDNWYAQVETVLNGGNLDITATAINVTSGVTVSDTVTDTSKLAAGQPGIQGGRTQTDTDGNHMQWIIAYPIEEEGEDDLTPDGFAFTDETNVPLSTFIEGEPITVSGITAPTPISVTGGQYSLDGAAWTSSPGTVDDGDLVYPGGTSSAAYSTTVGVVIAIGGVSDTFSITTEAEESDDPAYVSRPGLIWFDASDAATVALSGANVTGWLNKRGGSQGNLTKNGSAGSITYHTAAVNGLGVLRLVGSAATDSTRPRLSAVHEDGITAPNLTEISKMFQGNDVPWTMSVVHKPTDTTSTFVWSASVSLSTTSLSGLAYLRRDVANAVPQNTMRRVASGTTYTNADYGDGVAVNEVNVTTARFNGATIDVWENGAHTVVAAAWNTGAINTGAVFRVFAFLRDGTSITFSATQGNMDLCEIVGDAVALSDAECLQDNLDLIAKWT